MTYQTRGNAAVDRQILLPAAAVPSTERLLVDRESH